MILLKQVLPTGVNSKMCVYSASMRYEWHNFSTPVFKISSKIEFEKNENYTKSQIKKKIGNDEKTCVIVFSQGLCAILRGGTHRRRARDSRASGVEWRSRVERRRRTLRRRRPPHGSPPSVGAAAANGGADGGPRDPTLQPPTPPPPAAGCRGTPQFYISRVLRGRDPYPAAKS